MEIFTKLKQKENGKTCFLQNEGLVFLFFFFYTCCSTSPGCFAILFHKALNKQVLLIFKSCPVGRAGKATVNCLRAEHVVWITSLLMSSGVTQSCTGVSFFSVRRSEKKEFVRGGKKKDPLGILSLLKSTFIYPSTILVMPLCSAEFPLYCKASKPNLENNDYIVHVSTGL